MGALPQAWLYKWNDAGVPHSNRHRNWVEFFDAGKSTTGFGQADGKGGARLAQMAPGQILFAYQTNERALVGVCRITGVDHVGPSVTFEPIRRFLTPVRVQSLKQKYPEVGDVAALKPGPVFAFRSLSDRETRLLMKLCGQDIRLYAVAPSPVEVSSDRVRPVATHAELLANMDTFRHGILSNRDLATDLIRRTWYWLHDPASGFFAPSKFVGFANMSFPTYRASRVGRERDRGFNGGRSRDAIQAVLASQFSIDKALQTQCSAFVDRLFVGVLAGVSREKWKFVSLPHASADAAREREVANLAESLRAGGQGFCSSPEMRKVIELHAMRMATTHFEKQGFEVADVSARESYDLDCRRGAERVRVEVKGTETDGSTVILTRNEVALARRHHPHTALAIVANIESKMTADGPKASGGMLHLICPWAPADDALSPISYEYQVTKPKPY